MNIIDSFPIPVCRFARAKFSKLFKGIAAYGKELGNQTFYGFRLHVKINSLGMIQAFDLAPANVHDIRMLKELTEANRGMLLGDRAYPNKLALIDTIIMDILRDSKVTQKKGCKRCLQPQVRRNHLLSRISIYTVPIQRVRSTL